jgi:rhodanese-related sulfurtransferase
MKYPDLGYYNYLITGGIMKSLFSAFMLISLLTNTYAGKVETPSSLSGAKIVTAAEAKALQDSGALVVDVRKKLEYAEKHIKGAMSLPYKEKSKKVAGFDMGKDRWKIKKIADHKNKDIIFQCNGKTCWKSYKASKTAVKNGFTKVHWFRGGIPEWNKAGYPTE